MGGEVVRIVCGWMRRGDGGTDCACHVEVQCMCVYVWVKGSVNVINSLHLSPKVNDVVTRKGSRLPLITAWRSCPGKCDRWAVAVPRPGTPFETLHPPCACTCTIAFIRLLTRRSQPSSLFLPPGAPVSFPPSLPPTDRLCSASFSPWLSHHHHQPHTTPLLHTSRLPGSLARN